MKTIYPLFFLAMSASAPAMAATLDNASGNLSCNFRGLSTPQAIVTKDTGSPQTTIDGYTYRIRLDANRENQTLQTTGSVNDNQAHLVCKGSLNQTVHFEERVRLKRVVLRSETQYINGNEAKINVLMKGTVIKDGKGDVFEKTKEWKTAFSNSNAVDTFVEATSVCGNDLTVRLQELSFIASRSASLTSGSSAGIAPNFVELVFEKVGNEGCVDGQPVPGEGLASGALQGVFKIVARHSGKCLDARDHGTWNGVRMQQWACTGEPHQTFNVVDVGNGWYNLVANGGRCVSAEAVKMDNGTPMILWDCNGGPDQKVQFVPSANGSYTVRFQHSNKCMDVQDFSSDNGKDVHQWQCSNGADQDWYLQN